VFYFGLMADVTPPVGLASFAASAISRADPVMTGVQAFRYELRTAILPLMFIYNHQLLLIGLESWPQLILMLVCTLVAMLVFVSVTQSIFISRSRIWESAVLLLACFMIFRPVLFMEQIREPYLDAPGTEVVAIAEAAPDNAFLRVEVAGTNLEGEDYTRLVQLPLGAAGRPGAERLAGSGLQV